MLETIIENLSCVLVLTGGIIIIVFFYFQIYTKKVFKTLLEIIKLNERINHDPRLFIKNSLEKLKEKKFLKDYSYKISYLGMEIIKEKDTNEEGIHKSQEAEYCQIYIEIIPYILRGERKFACILILETLFLLVRMDILIKIKSFEETLKHISKLQTYLQHDIKNIAQFIKGLSYNLKNINTYEERNRLIKYLKESSPILEIKANRILSNLYIKIENNKKKEINIKNIINELIKFYKLGCEVKGNATIYSDESKLFLIFDNILKNIYDKSLEDKEIKCNIKIEDEKEKITIMVKDTGAKIQSEILCEDIDRIFEPFATTKKNGLGIGLYQTKLLIEELGGKITAENSADGVIFKILFYK